MIILQTFSTSTRSPSSPQRSSTTSTRDSVFAMEVLRKANDSYSDLDEPDCDEAVVVEHEDMFPEDGDDHEQEASEDVIQF